MSESLNISDPYKRRLTYVRFSVTDVCNFRCQYCLPNGYLKPKKPRTPLNIKEIGNFAEAFINLGFKKIRLTGGEPLTRQDIVSVVSTVKNKGFHIVTLTTNAYRLHILLKDLKAAGLSYLNISLDSLDSGEFYRLTGHNKFTTVMKGIDKALEYDIPVKINVVLLKGMNNSLAPFLQWVKDKPVIVRFIELMPTNQAYFRQYFCSSKSIEQYLIDQGWQQKVKNKTDGPAREYSHADYQGQLAFITPLQAHFCESCNRLRVTAYGELAPCLFGEIKVNLRPECHDINLLQHRIKEVVKHKPPHHYLTQGIVNYTKSLSSIGG